MLSAGAEARRRRVLAALALAALAAHLLLIGAVEIAPSRVEAAVPVAALQVRTIVAPVVAAPEPKALPHEPQALPHEPQALPHEPQALPHEPQALPHEPQAPETPPVKRRVRVPPPQPVLVAQPLYSASPNAQSRPVEPMKPEREPAVPPETAAEPAPVLAATALVPAAPAPTEDDAVPPLYATQMPPPVTLRYELRRGPLSGSGDLFWRPQDGRYELRLEGTVLGVNVLRQASGGALDANGLAPQRFTDQRARRAMVAANFEREAGRIRFSGPSHEVPWQPGVQDRLSWMVQLAAVAAAQPARLAAGERIVLQVVGARGDASMWAFRSLGAETLTMFSTRTETVKLLREPRFAHDTRVEVWLDPARHHLPVRATLGSSEDDRLELRLREMQP